MRTPYLNVDKEPYDAQGHSGIGGGLRALWARTTGQHLGEEEDEELASRYTSIQEEYDAAFQRDFSHRWSERTSSFGDAVRSALPEVPGFLRGQGASARSPQSQKHGLVHSLTPSFLRTDEDEDLASTCCPHLGIRQRVFGCVVCLVCGQLVQFFSFGSVAGVLVGHPGRFACLYTLGNLLSLAGSFFLSGPQAQLRKIMAKDRALTSFIFVSTMLLTLAVVFMHHFFGRALLILVLVAVQWCALVWYILSYIPYGHSVARRSLSWVCTF